MKTTAHLLALALLLVPALLTAQPAAPTQNPSVAPATLEGRISEKLENRYLTNARVTIEGTNYETLTNEYGDYRFPNLPPGDYTITAFFTGLDPKTHKITLAPGQRLTHDFELSNKETDQETKTAKTTGPIVNLDTYSVVAKRETSISTIATNEQRFAQNIKTVIDTNAFGDVTTGNVGDFLKFLPGVSVNYDGADPSSAQVRGFGASYTAVTSDGMPVANASGDAGGDGAATRTFMFDQMSLNNISRIEVTKVPLPSMRADSLGGNVNMISKNAFERKTMQFNYRASANFNTAAASLKKTPTPNQNGTIKTRPNFDFDLTLPLSKRFGIVLTAQHSDQYTARQSSRYEWVFENNPKGHDFKQDVGNTKTPDPATAYYYFQIAKPDTGFGPYVVTPPPTVAPNTKNPDDPGLLYTPLYYPNSKGGYAITNGSAQHTDYLQYDPIMQRYATFDQPKLSSKDSLGLRADWRITRNSTLSFSWQTGYTAATQQNYNMSWDIMDIAAFKVPLSVFTNITTLDQLLNPSAYGITPTFIPANQYVAGTRYYLSDYFRDWGFDPAYGGYYSKGVNGGKSKIQHNAGVTDKYGLTHALNLKYNYTGAEWTFDTTLNYSTARSWQRDMQNGHFSNVLTTMSGNVDQVTIGGIQSQNAPTILIGKDPNGDPIDVTDLSSYTIKQVTTNPSDSTDTFKTLQANLKRTFNYLPFYASIKTGGEIRTQTRDTVRSKMIWSTLLDDTNGGTPASAYLDTAYHTRSQGFGLPHLNYPSPYLLYQAYLNDIQYGGSPSIPGIPYTNGYLFSYLGIRLGPDSLHPWDPSKGIQATFPTPPYEPYASTWPTTSIPGVTGPDVKVNGKGYGGYEEYRFANDYRLQETITSYYLQLDAKFLDNRLSITTGFRFEGTQDRGLSAYMPVFQIPDPQNPTVYLTDDQLNTTGAYANINGNLQDAYNKLKGDFIRDNWVIRGKKSTKSYADIYPSFFANYNLTANTITRFSYAKTLGRPDFTNIIPMARYNNLTNIDGDAYTRIKTSNPALKPYTASNFDLSIEHYFENGGMASAALFYKKVANAFGNQTVHGTAQLLAEMGISNTFVNPQLVTQVNVGTLTAKGFELNLKSPLTFIPCVGRYINLIANTTIMDIKAPYNANLEGFVKKSANWGASINTKRLTLMFNWNWRGEQKLQALTDVSYQPQDQTTQTPLPEDFQGFYEYIAPRLTLDANLEFRLTRQINLFVNARNLTNARMVWQRYNNKTPSYAKTYLAEEYGSQISIGLKGSF